MTDADTQPVQSSARRSFVKAISWRVIGSLDTLFLSFVILTFLGPAVGMENASHADNLKTSTLIAVTEVVTKIVIYYLHDRAWDRVRWGADTARPGISREGRRRSIAKTATWRVIATLDTMILAYVFTGSLEAAISIGSLEVLTKLVLYYGHERFWAHVTWS